MDKLSITSAIIPTKICHMNLNMRKSDKTRNCPVIIKPVNPKGNQLWIFTGRTDAESEAPILWPPDAKNWLFGKDPDAGKDWRQEEEGATEDELVGWHHWLNGHEFEQTLGDSEGQGSLACCRSWGHKDSDKTEQLNNKILTTVPFPVFLVQLFLLNCFFYQDLLTPTLMYDFPNHSKSTYDFSFFPILDFTSF